MTYQLVSILISFKGHPVVSPGHSNIIEKIHGMTFCKTFIKKNIRLEKTKTVQIL